VRQRFLNIMRARLNLIGDRRRFPEIATEEIRRPVMALGLRRAGSTFLLGLELRRDSEIDKHFFDCHFQDMIADPIAMVRRIYERFDMELTPEGLDAMTRSLETDPHTKG
jgi:hypothetical protein